MQVQMTISQKSFMQGGLGETTSVNKDIFYSILERLLYKKFLYSNFRKYAHPSFLP